MASPENTPAPAPGSPQRPRQRWMGRALQILGLILLALATKFVLHLLLPRNYAASGESLPLKLPHGTFETHYYNGPKPPRGIVIVGTGDGGWSYWEEKVSQHLATQGYAVGGWDCRAFADSRAYDQAELVAGFRLAVEAVQNRAHVQNKKLPVWYAGWSTGAEQAVAAASSPDRPPMLKGLLLAAPGARGAYTITQAYLLGMEPTGPDSYAMADMAPGLTGLSITQFTAGLDPLDDTSWLESLAGMKTVRYQLIELPGVMHDMGEAGEEFQQKLDEAMAWTLAKP
jgi:phosphatidylglycerol lysyltransferase